MTTLTTKKAPKSKTKPSYEMIFFAVVVLAWAVLAVFFNMARHELEPGDKAASNTTRAKTAAAGMVKAPRNP
jgi:hypothetical protein